MCCGTLARWGFGSGSQTEIFVPNVRTHKSILHPKDTSFVVPWSDAESRPKLES